MKLTKYCVVIVLLTISSGLFGYVNGQLEFILKIVDINTSGNDAVEPVENVERIKDRPSILEIMSVLKKPFAKQKVIKQAAESLKFQTSSMTLSNCNKLGGQLMKTKIKDSIERTLNFYSSHLDKLDMKDYAVGLGILKSVDHKHTFQRKYPIADWSSEICGKQKQKNGLHCNAFISALQSRSKHWKNWSHLDVLQNIQENLTFEQLGNEKETVWATLNHDCWETLLVQCEVPHVCERVMFDPEPRSQYMLTHQLLHRIFAQTKMTECSLPARLVDNNVNQQLCSKMYQEATLISGFGGPEVFRDLFAEQIAFCGFVGYPNFIREDWISMILSLQSKSDFGCFTLNKKQESDKVVSSGRKKTIKLTKAETKNNAAPSVDEICQPHFTSVALLALAVTWNYLEKNCI